MNPRQRALAQRRQLLQLQSGLLREGLGLQCAQLAQRVRPATRAVDGLRGLLRHPALAAAAGVLLVAIRPWRAIKWASRGALAVSILRHGLAVFTALRR